MIQILAHRNLQ